MGNMIDLDVTLFVQLVNFLITIIVLNYLLIKPVRERIASRKSLTEGYAQDIEKFTAEASDKLTGYEKSLSDARMEAAKKREAIRAEGSSSEQEILHSAHEKAQAFLQSSREDTANQAKAAMQSLLSQVDGYAAKAMTKILG